MSQFMVEFALPELMTQEFVATVPRHRLKINELMKEGKIVSYCLAADRLKLWCIVKANNEIEVMEIIAEFPLIDFMSPTINELMFSNTVAIRLPMFSLN